MSLDAVLKTTMNTRHAEVVLVVEEIIFQIVFMLTMMIVRRRNSLQGRRRICNRRVRYKMSTNMLKQVEHMADLVGMSDIDCLNNLRMDRGTFSKLCYLLKHNGGLVDGRYVSVAEQVALFLTVLAHHTKVRVVRFGFKRSTHTVNKYFHIVLQAVLSLHNVLLAKPIPIGDDCNDSRWKHFKGCLGALDGTYVDVTVPEAIKIRYRTRKGTVSVNVLAACDKNMRFTYILAGWEGSAADARVLRDALHRPNGLRVQQGTYYLCDNGYANAEGFLTPYKMVRYHLREWGEGQSTPQNYKEYFNMKHSKARNVIERTFDLLKKRWSILRSPSFYPILVQNRIILACGLLHNFVRNEMPNDLAEFDDDPVILHQDDADGGEYIDSVQPTQEWGNWREILAQGMYNSWRGVA